MEAVENIPRTPCFPQAPTATTTAGFLTALTSEELTTATESDLNRVSAKSREAQTLSISFPFRLCRTCARTVPD